jgi:hypothetical protein
LKVARHTIWPVALALAIFMASGSKDLAAPNLGFDFSYDKLAHLLVFGLLATAVLRIPGIFNGGWQGVCTTIDAPWSGSALDLNLALLKTREKVTFTRRYLRQNSNLFVHQDAPASNS